MDSCKKHKNPWLFARLGRKPKMYFLLRPGSCSWFCIGRILKRFWISSFDFFFLSCPREAQHSSLSLYFMYKLDGTQLFPFAGISMNFCESHWKYRPWLGERFLEYASNGNLQWQFHASLMLVRTQAQHLKTDSPPKVPSPGALSKQEHAVCRLVLFQYSTKYTSSLDHNLWTSICKMYNPNLCDANSSCTLAAFKAVQLPFFGNFRLG